MGNKRLEEQHVTLTSVPQKHLGYTHAGSVWKSVEEEERTQLHVVERVGVACRKLEHPESAG